jgi:hypothetical protein
VDALIAEIAVRRPHFINMSRLLTDRAWRVSQLREWLASAPVYGGLTAEDIETLSNDPPLPFFILFEAMHQRETRGMCLGPLGSIIVSEVIFRALHSESESVEGSTTSLVETLANLAVNHYRKNIFADVPEIERMDQLVEFIAELGDLRQAVPAFL